VDALLEDGHEITIVDEVSIGKLENVERVLAKVEFHR
jgi:UDP-glucose 4-epimerase